ncbi:hypothetical protein ACFYWN_43285 [Streptomyces sp. NPDC002917]
MDRALLDPRTARIQRDVALVEELAAYEFSGPVYEVLNNRLCGESPRCLR